MRLHENSESQANLSGKSCPASGHGISTLGFRDRLVGDDCSVKAISFRHNSSLVLRRTADLYNGGEGQMKKELLIGLVIAVTAPLNVTAQDASSVIDASTKAMGAASPIFTAA